MTGRLIKCDDEDWMKGREDILPERSHRHPHCWWDLKTGWVNEQGEPKKPNWKKCGTNVLSPEYMVDEFPEQQPDEHVNLKCMRKEVALHCIDLSTPEAGVTFTEIWDPLLPQCFEAMCAERREAAKAGALLKNKQLVDETKKKVWALRHTMRRNKMRTHLRNKKRRAEFKTFQEQVQSRLNEGYSLRQLMESHIPEIGKNVEVTEAEVSRALQAKDHTIVFLTLTIFRGRPQ